MNPILQHALANWKSTVQSLLSGYLSIFAALTGADFAGVGGLHYSRYFLISGIVAKAILGVIQSDAKPAVTSSVTIESTSPIEVPPIEVTQAKEKP